MIQNQYICKICHGNFIKGRSDDQAEKDFLQTFPDKPLSDVIKVCEECYRNIIKDLKDGMDKSKR